LSLNKRKLHVYFIIILSLQENVSLVTNFRDQILLVSIMTNLDTNIYKVKNYWLLKY